MTSFTRPQRKYVQKASRVRNGREYETGLRARGSLTVWLGLTDGKLRQLELAEADNASTRTTPSRRRSPWAWCLAWRPGRLRAPARAADAPDSGQRRARPQHDLEAQGEAGEGCFLRAANREARPPPHRQQRLAVHVGQWRTPPKARDSRKRHLAVDEQPSDGVAGELTSTRARDASRGASLVGQIERPIASATADAAYATGDVSKTLEHHRAHRSPKVLIPPRKGAQLARDSAGTRPRHRHIRAQSRVGKRKGYVASGDAGDARGRRRSTATRPSWAQRGERGDWRPRESR